MRERVVWAMGGFGEEGEGREEAEEGGPEGEGQGVLYLVTETGADYTRWKVVYEEHAAEQEGT